MDRLLEANIAGDVELGLAFLSLSQTEHEHGNAEGEEYALQCARDATLDARRTLRRIAAPGRRTRLERQINPLELAIRAFGFARKVATSFPDVRRGRGGVVQKHVCDFTCECKLNLDLASAALAQSSALLSESIFSAPDDSIAQYYALVRNAANRLARAAESYEVHLTQISALEQ